MSGLALKISVVLRPIEAYDKAAVLRLELVQMLNQRVTLGQVVDRALDCLDDAHRRGAWLSPREAAPILDQRHETDVVNVVGQLLIGLDVPFDGISVDRERRIVTVHRDAGDVTLFDPALGPNLETVMQQ